MSTLVFKVATDYEKVIQLRQEIEKLKQALSSNPTDNRSVQDLQVKLSKAKTEYSSLLTTAAQTGAAVENGFNKSATALLNSQKNVDGITSKMITQKQVVADLQSEVRRLQAAYSAAQGGDKQSLKNQIVSKKKQLEDEKISLNKLRTEQDKAKLTVKGLKDEIGAYEKTLKKSIVVQDQAGSSLGGMTKAFAYIGGGAAIAGFAKQVVDVRAQMQSVERSYEVLLGSQEKAAKKIAELKEYAIISPLTFTDLSDATKTLLGFNVEAEKLMPILKALGDVSMGESGKFASLSLAFAQMSAAGKLMGQDLNQMINAGFNPLQEISRTTGKSIANLKDEMSKGAVSAEMVEKAFLSATAAGGKFYGMAEKGADGIRSAQSNMENQITESLNSLGKNSESIITGTYNSITLLLQNYEKIGKVLVGIIASYGTYKAALITVTALEKGYTVAQLAQYRALLVTEKAQKLLNATMLKNPYVLCATLVIGLASAMWALHDSTTAAEKAQKKHTDRLDEQNRKSQEAKAKAEELLNIITSTTSAELDRVSAMGELKKLYPQIFEKYDTENIKLADKLSILKQINEEEAIRRNMANSDHADNLRNQIKVWESEKERILKSANFTNTTALNNPAIREIDTKINVIKEELKITQEVSHYVKKAQAEFDKKPVEVKVKFYQDKLSTLKTDRSSLLSQINTKNAFDPTLFNDKMQLKSLNAEIEEYTQKLSGLSETQKEIQQNKSFWEKEKKDAEALLEALDIKKKGTSEWIALEKKIKNADNQLKKYSTSDSVDDKSKSLAESVKSNDLSLNAERLAIMEDGKKKRLLLSEQEHAEKKAALEKEYKETVESYKKLGIATPTGLTETYKDRLTKNDESKLKRDAQIEKESSKEIADAQKYLTAVFLSEEAKRLEAINDRYNKQREWAKKQLEGGGMDENQYTSFVSEVDKAQSYENLQSLLEQYKEWSDKRLQIEKDFNEQLDTLEKGRTKENSAEIDKAAKQLQESKDRALSKLSLEELKDGDLWVKMFSDLDRMAIGTLENILEKAKEVDTSAWDPEQVKEYEDAIKRLTDAIESRNPFKSLQMNWSKLMNGIKSGNKDSIASGLEGISSAVDKINGDLNTIAGGIGEIFGEEAGYAAEQVVALTSALGGFSDAASKIAKGDVLGGIASVVSSVASIFSIGKKVKEMNRAAREENQKFYDQAKKGELEYQMLIRERLRLEQQIGESMTGYNKRITEELEKQKKANEDTYNEKWKQLQGESYISGKGYRHGTWFRKAKTWNEYDSLAGKSYDDIEKLYMEGKLEGKAKDLFEELQKLKEEGVDIDKMLADNAEAFNEYISGISFDGAKDSLKSFLLSANGDINDLADNLEDAMRNAIVNLIIDNIMNDRIKKWYEDFVAFMKNKDSMTEEEIKKKREELQNEYIQIGKDSQDLKDEAFLAAGITNKKTQNASSGGFQTMSQDTGSELNGRFTAVQIATEKIVIYFQQLNAVITNMNDHVVGLHNIADETRDILVNSYMALMAISDNTGAVVKPIKEMKEILNAIMSSGLKVK